MYYTCTRRSSKQQQLRLGEGAAFKRPRASRDTSTTTTTTTSHAPLAFFLLLLREREADILDGMVYVGREREKDRFGSLIFARRGLVGESLSYNVCVCVVAR